MSISKASKVNTSPDQDPANRQANGQFGVGNKSGQGFPFNASVQRLRSAMIAAVTAEDIAQVIGKVLDQAKEGNLAAVKLLLSYTIGQPHQTVQPDRSELDGLETQNKAEFTKEQIAQRARFNAARQGWTN